MSREYYLLRYPSISFMKERSMARTFIDTNIFLRYLTKFVLSHKNKI